MGWKGRKGRCLALVEMAESDHVWAVVKWDDEDDPDNQKAQSLEVIPEEDVRWPRPWNRVGFMITDRSGREVVNLGGTQSHIGSSNLEALCVLIVESVNKYSEK